MGEYVYQANIYKYSAHYIVFANKCVVERANRNIFIRIAGARIRSFAKKNPAYACGLMAVGFDWNIMEMINRPIQFGTIREAIKCGCFVVTNSRREGIYLEKKQFLIQYWKKNLHLKDNYRSNTSIVTTK